MPAGHDDAPERWKFPIAKGFIADEENGLWSDGAFFNDLLIEEDQVPEVWHPAEPTDPVADAPANARWRAFVATPEG